MSYLPNSIERCASILHFDPYAYIMDRESNLQIQKMTSPYDNDYFGKNPKNTDNMPNSPDNSQKAHKQGKKGGKINALFTALKIGAAVTSVVALGITGKKAIGAIGKFLGKSKIKAPKITPKTGFKGKISNIFSTVTGGAKKAWSFVSGKACVFGKFVSGKFHDFINFVKKKP